MLHVLVVEDSEQTREALEIILRSKGFWVKSMATAQEAIPWLTVGPLPDRVVVDYYLLSGVGTSLIEELRKMDAGNRVPVVVMTAAPPSKVDELKKSTALLGPIRFVEKPFEPEQLLEALQ